MCTHCSMAPEPWNRIHIPRPGTQCQISVPLTASTGQCLADLTDKCSAVLSALKRKRLAAEVAALDSLLLFNHNKLRHHKPYGAVKQVQQCIKRIKSMRLEASLKEMMDLCPKKAELKSKKSCTVPSQPILELVSMKILGSSKLLERLMDCCCRAFNLCLQHLIVQEFIVLNWGLLALLSRLWVMYRGLLKQHNALYSAHISMQKTVSDFQKMPYFPDFVFPSNLKEHVASVPTPLVTSKIQKRLSKECKLQFVTQMFDTSNLFEEEEKMSKNGGVYVKETQGILDVGQPVQMRKLKKGKPATFDVKSLFLPVKASSLQDLGSKRKLKEPKKRHGVSQHSRKEECVRHLVPKIQEAEDFKALSNLLLYAVKWCEERKLKAEVGFFRDRYLRCNRLQHAEALGCSLKKKLQFLKKSTCRSLHKQTLRKDHLKGCLRIQRLQQLWKRGVVHSQRHRRVKRKDFKRSLQCSDLFPDEQKPSSDAARRPWTSELQESSAKGTDGCPMQSDHDIDDIFSSIGI